MIILFQKNQKKTVATMENIIWANADAIVCITDPDASFATNVSKIKTAETRVAVSTCNPPLLPESNVTAKVDGLVLPAPKVSAYVNNRKKIF